MQIKIRFFSYIKFETGLDSIEIQVKDGGTVDDLIDSLDNEYGDDLIRFIKAKDLDKILSLFVRENKILKRDETLLDGDELKVMPSVAGG